MFKLLALLLIILEFVLCHPRRCMYNCVATLAEVFPIAYVRPNFGQKEHEPKGEIPDNVKANLPAYQQKIQAAQAEIENSMPTDPNKVMDQYLQYRKSLFDRDSNETFSQTKEELFMEKMKIKVYENILGNTVRTSFQFLTIESPLDWVDSNHLLYFNLMQRGIHLNYVYPNRRRKAKVVSWTDPCTELAKSLNNDDGWLKGTAKNALNLVFDCYDSFPYSLELANQDFDLSILMVDFYVFNNFTSNGLGSSNLLRALKSQQLPFDSQLRFHEFLSTTFNNMNDAHMTCKADCFNQFTFIQPLYIQVIEKTFIITKVNIPELQEYVNYVITAIDGMSPYTSFFEVSNNLGKSHNSDIRLTLSTSRLYFDSTAQDFRLDRGLYLKRFFIPNKPYIIFTIRKQESLFELYEIKVHWMVFKNPSLSPFKDQVSYWKSNCEAKPLPRIVTKSTTSLQRRSSSDLIQFRKNPRKRSNRVIPIKKRDGDYKATSEGTTPLVVGPGFAFFIMQDEYGNDYAVLIIQTFDVTDMEGWFKNMRKGFAKLTEQGIDRLLLDLTGNSGGILCLAYNLLGVLSPSSVFPFPATQFTYGTRAVPSDSLIRISKCVDEAGIKGSPFKLQSFTNLETRSDFPDSIGWGYGSEIKPKIVNGITSGYTKFSPFLMDKCILKYSYLLADIKPKFTRIIILTDGLCGSSCAIVAAYLHQHGNVGIVLQLYFYEGNSISNLYAFAGGQVLNLNNVRDVAFRSSCVEMLPNNLERVQFTVTYRAIFNLADKNNPLEYYIMPAEWRYGYSEDFIKTFSTRWYSAFQEGMEIAEYGGRMPFDFTVTGRIFPYSTLQNILL